MRAEALGLDDMNPSLSLRFESEFALQTRDGHGQKFHNNGFAELRLAPLPSLLFVGRFRVKSEALDELDPGRFSTTTSSYARGTKPATPGDVWEFEHREIYLQWTQGPLRVRGGKQQLIWGEAKGFQVLDLLNPQDFTEFILADIEEARIPLWSLSVDLELGEYGVGYSSWLPEGSALQLLFIPDPTVHHIPDIEDLGQGPDALYAPTSEFIVPELPSELADFVVFETVQSRPKWKASNFDAGARLTLPIGGVDMALHYLWHIDDLPTIAYALGFNTTGAFDLDLLAFPVTRHLPIQMENRRYHMAGASVSKAIGEWVLRGEFSYAFDRVISLDFDTWLHPTVNQPIRRSDDISWLVGLDWFGLSNTLLSVQFHQAEIANYDETMLRRRVETTMTFFVHRSFLNDRLSVDLTYIRGMKEPDGLARGKVTYAWNDTLSLWTGADVFHGGGNGYFGQYDGNDRVLFGFSLGWTSDV
jgi:hypothetical protein